MPDTSSFLRWGLRRKAESPRTLAMEEVQWDLDLPGLPLHGRLWERESASTLLVLMPSAVSRTAKHRHPSYARWQWADSFSESHVVALADPIMGMHEQLQGAWYMHPEKDVVGAMAVVIEQLADRLGAASVLMYGSSLGGFGALAIATVLARASAIAEVPQLDFERWGPEARQDLERYVLGGDLASHRQRHPEQVSIRARMELSGRIPPFTLVSNVLEQGFEEQLSFLRWVSDAETALTKVGRHELRVVDDVLGHRPLPSAEAMRLIKESLAELQLTDR